MVRNLLTRVAVFFLISLGFASSTLGQCGTYFRSDYRVPGKVGRELNFGFYVLNDWTGDGRSDFWNFRLNQSTQTADIIIYPSLAAGYWNWNAPIVYSTTLPSSVSTSNLSYVIKDFDSDGRIDMLVTSGSSGNIVRHIHRNIGDGTLQPQAPTTDPSGVNPSVQNIDYADLNGDGRLDWIYTLDDVDVPMNLYFAPGNADGSFGPAVFILAETLENQLNPSHRMVADFDGDGKPDIAYSNFSSNPHVRLIKNLGNGTFSLGFGLSVPTAFAAFADFNNDARADLYTKHNSSLVVLSGQSNATFSSAVYPITNPNASLHRSADFNGDSRQDVIMVGHQDYEIFLSNPTGGFTTHFYPKTLKYRATVTTLPPMVFEDFSGDGKADLYFANHDFYNAYLEEVVVIKKGFCDFKSQPRAMNFDSNPLPDIVTWNGTNGQWRYGNGDWNSGASVPIQSFNWGSAALGDAPAPGDFDGDGLTDHTVYRNGEGNWYMYLSSTSAWSVFHFGLPGDIPIPNDYDGGGTTDFAVFRPSDGNWYIWYNEAQQFNVVHWGANGDRPVPADFDGDGKTDIAVFRPSEGNWYYVRSSDSGVGIFNWGLGTDVALPADYDGDGKADLTVYRSGTWYILRSWNGTFGPVFYGSGNDIPIPFLDRGEVWLPVVYRQTNSRWYSNRYPIGFSLLLSGTPVYFGLPNN